MTSTTKLQVYDAMIEYAETVGTAEWRRNCPTVRDSIRVEATSPKGAEKAARDRCKHLKIKSVSVWAVK